MMHRFLFLFFLFVFCSSCGPILKVIYGIEAPEYKSDAEVLNYAKKKLNIESSIYRVKEYEGQATALDISTIPSMKYYYQNQIKELNETCVADYSTFINAPLDSLNNLSNRYIVDLAEVEALLYDCSENKSSISDKPTFLIFYANYVGSLNKKNLIPWIEQLEKRNDVNYLLVNCDITKRSDNPTEKNKVIFEKD